jgi:hypothetical protein
MKRTFLMATLGGLLAFGAISGTVGAQSPAPAQVEKEKAAKPAAKKAAKKTMAADQSAKSDLQVKQQPTGPEPSSPTPTGELALGTVKLPKKVTANGQPLAPGTYQVRLTPQEAESKAQGATAAYERWAEFVQGGQVKGKEVVSIVPAADASKVAKEPAPAAGRAKIEQLKGDDYLRVWINKGGNYYLIHLGLQAS